MIIEVCLELEYWSLELNKKTMEENKKPEVVEVPSKFKVLVESIEKLSVLELNELVKLLEKKFGVSATAAVTVAPAAAGGVPAG